MLKPLEMNTRIIIPSPLARRIREIRHPLCNITLACDMINSTDLDPEQKQFLDILKRGAWRISAQLDLLLRGEVEEA